MNGRSISQRDHLDNRSTDGAAGNRIARGTMVSVPPDRNVRNYAGVSRRADSGFALMPDRWGPVVRPSPVRDREGFGPRGPELASPEVAQ